MAVKDIIFSIIILVLLIFLSWQTIKGPSFVIKEIQKQDTIIVRDTIRIEAKAKIIYRNKYKYVQSQDSTLTSAIEKQADSSSFAACFDTTVAKTFLNVCYFHPENKFWIDIRSQPDTITKYITIEKPIFKYEQQKDKWTTDMLKIGGGLVLGFLLGRIK